MSPPHRGQGEDGQAAPGAGPVSGIDPAVGGDRPPGRGRFITLEGIDGAGKSTHLQRLVDWLQARGHRVELTREPGGTALAESLRALFLGQPMDALTEALLVFAGRRDHLQQRIEPALAAGRWVVCDRFTDATFAYQGAGRGFDAEVLATLERWVQTGPSGFVEPDLTLWFDLPPEVAAGRRAAARAADRLEQEDLDFFARVAAGYARRAAAAPERMQRIDAGLAPEAVWQAIESVLVRKPWAQRA